MGSRGARFAGRRNARSRRSPRQAWTGSTPCPQQPCPLRAGSSQRAPQACGARCGDSGLLGLRLAPAPASGSRPRPRPRARNLGSAGSARRPASWAPALVERRVGRSLRRRPRVLRASSGASSTVERRLELGRCLGAMRLRLGLDRRLRLGLGGLHRGELLLGRQLAALGDDERLHLDADVLEDLDRDRVAADPLDRVGVDLPAVDADLARLARSRRRCRSSSPSRRARRSGRT